MPSPADFKFKQLALIGKYQSSSAGMRATLPDLAQFLSAQGLDVCFERETASGLDDQAHSGYGSLSIEEIGKRCDAAIVVGGDGTMLGIGRQLAQYKLPMIGINQGRLGFITDIALSDYRTALPAMLRGECEREYRPLIQASVWRDGACVFDALAMNDVVVNRGASSGMVELRVEIDGRFVSNQRADGLIIATPTGSTAYALSAGGPIMHPALGGWVMVPIAPHTLSNRPLSLSDRSQITIELVAGKEASANFDMQSLASLLPGDRILVRRAEHAACFLHPKGWSYFDTLRHKLHWNEGNV